jgi:hypothetical protein
MHDGRWKLIETPQHDVLDIQTRMKNRCSWQMQFCCQQFVRLIMNLTEIPSFWMQKEPWNSPLKQKKFHVNFFHFIVINIKFPLKLFTHSQRWRKTFELSVDSFGNGVRMWWSFDVLHLYVIAQSTPTRFHEVSGGDKKEKAISKMEIRTRQKRVCLDNSWLFFNLNWGKNSCHT